MENQIPGNSGRPNASFKAGQRPPDPRVPAGPTRTTRPGPSRARRPNWPVIFGLSLLSLVVVAAVGFFGVNAVLDSQYTGKIEPGASISGVYVGEMSRSEA